MRLRNPEGLPVEAEGLRRALLVLAERHPALRTTFARARGRAHDLEGDPAMPEFLARVRARGEEALPALVLGRPGGACG